MKTRDVSKRKPSGVSTVDTPSRPRSAKTRKTTRKAAGASRSSEGKSDKLPKSDSMSLSVKDLSHSVMTRNLADKWKVSRRTAQRWLKSGRYPEAPGMCFRVGKNGRHYVHEDKPEITLSKVEDACRTFGYSLNSFVRRVSEHGFTGDELHAFEGIVNRANETLDWLKAARERGDAK